MMIMMILILRAVHRNTRVYNSLCSCARRLLHFMWTAKLAFSPIPEHNLTMVASLTFQTDCVASPASAPFFLLSFPETTQKLHRLAKKPCVHVQRQP